MTKTEFQSWCRMAITLIDLEQTDKLREVLVSVVDDDKEEKYTSKGEGYIRDNLNLF